MGGVNHRQRLSFGKNVIICLFHVSVRKTSRKTFLGWLLGRTVEWNQRVSEAALPLLLSFFFGDDCSAHFTELHTSAGFSYHTDVLLYVKKVSWERGEEEFVFVLRRKNPKEKKFQNHCIEGKENSRRRGPNGPMVDDFPERGSEPQGPRRDPRGRLSIRFYRI